ncbi:MAG: MFS transporter [Deltaproteobacteria bacterium]|nr:MFS transporter [Deltaproteobacteria bacterium]
MFASIRKLVGSVRALGSERLSLLGVLTCGHIAIHWFQQILPVVLPSLKSGLGLSDVQVGALTSSRQLVQGTMNLPSGMLADSLVKYRGLILTAALLFMGMAYLLLGITSFFVVAIIGAGLVGLGSALWHPASVASLSNRFPERRATALAVHGMGATFGDTLTPLAVGFLLTVFPWKTVLQSQIVVGILLGFLIWVSLTGFFRDDHAQSMPAKQIREIASLARNPVFIGVSAARGFIQMGRLIILTFLPIYLQEHLGYSTFVLGVHLSLLHAMGFVSQPIMGYVSDRFGRKTVLAPSFVALGILYALLVAAAPGFQLGLVISAIGLFFYTLMNITNVAVMDVAGSKIQASSYGLTSLVTQLVVFPTPVVAGYLIGGYGISSAFIMAAVFAFLAALTIAPLKLYKGSQN